MLHEADLPAQEAGFGRVVTEGAGTHASRGHLILVDERWPLIERGVNPEIDLRDGASAGRSWPGTPSSRLLLWYLHRAVEDSHHPWRRLPKFNISPSPAAKRLDVSWLTDAAAVQCAATESVRLGTTPCWRSTSSWLRCSLTYRRTSAAMAWNRASPCSGFQKGS